VFDAVRDEAVEAYGRIIGLDLSEVAVDGSMHKAPCGGEGTGRSPVDRAKLGWKWSVATDANGIPLGWAIDGANRNDMKLLEPTLNDVARVGLLIDIETLHLDRGYDFPKIRAQLTEMGLDDLNIQKRKPRGVLRQKQPMRLGLRWVVEGTNSWLSNYGQLRRNTDRSNRHRHAQLSLVTTLLITAKLIDWRDRWSPESRPIR
jgi:IS5 family transposase